jgi:ABC-type proline/glycine betaine transport system permease subunit
MKKRWYSVGCVLWAIIVIAALVFEGDGLSRQVIRVGGVLEVGMHLVLGLGVVMLLGLAVIVWREADQEAAARPSDDVPPPAQ